MAGKKKLLDVWIVDLNTVYREVPYAVVTDWLQQGRLLGDDKVRSAGAANWHTIGRVPALAPYLPKKEEFRAEDQAEALEPVEVGFDWKRADEDDDEDVDMIPLIDISLVLLIFFMMTASVSSGFFSPINTPGARHQLAAISKDQFWIGIDIKGPDGKTEKSADGKAVPWYSLGRDTSVLHQPVRDPAPVLADFFQRVQKELAELPPPEPRDVRVNVRIRADQSLPIETIQRITLALQEQEADLKGKAKLAIAGEVSEPQTK
jgi:biopolymer transport protein ExbD